MKNCTEWLKDFVARLQPQRVLAVGAEAQQLLTEAGATVHSRIEPVTPPDAIQGRYDLALLVGELEQWPQRPLRQLLGRLRDLHADPLLIVHCPPTEPGRAHARWRREHFLALGMCHLLECERDGHPWQVYHFSLANYKTVPEWLNDRHWAHPHLYNKYRW